MVLLQLALKNIMGAKLRTWLNIFVLAMSFILIVWGKAIVVGMGDQIIDAMKDVELGYGGQLWHPDYDEEDPLTINDAHGSIPDELVPGIEAGQIVPILMATGNIYPEGKVRSVLIRGISPDQQILDLPSSVLKDRKGVDYPALIGKRMARKNNLAVGDMVTVRWRDTNGVFDAREVEIVHIMNTVVYTVDVGQIWFPLETLQKMLVMPNEATIIALSKDTGIAGDLTGWTYKSLDDLLANVLELLRMKNGGGNIMYGIMFSIALLAIFDTQVLSIFRRKKEIGTLMALGLTRNKVIGLFTLEGSLHGALAFILGGILGFPFFRYFAVKGYAMPIEGDEYGFALGNVIYAKYGADLLIGTTLLLMATVVLVSYLPTRRISKMTPTNALRGR